MKKNNFKIAVVGIGYVGLSNAILLSQKNHVVALDLSKQKIDLLKGNWCIYNITSPLCHTL